MEEQPKIYNWNALFEDWAIDYTKAGWIKLERKTEPTASIECRIQGWGEKQSIPDAIKTLRFYRGITWLEEANHEILTSLVEYLYELAFDTDKQIESKLRSVGVLEGQE